MLTIFVIKTIIWIRNFDVTCPPESEFYADFRVGSGSELIRYGHRRSPANQLDLFEIIECSLLTTLQTAICLDIYGRFPRSPPGLSPPGLPGNMPCPSPVTILAMVKLADWVPAE